jgi:hypothetical protein
MNDPVGRSLTIRLLHQQAVGGQLENMRIIWCIWRMPGFDFDRDNLSIVLNEVIRLAGQPKAGMEKRLFQFAPAARIGVNDPSTRQPGGIPLAARDPKEDEGNKEKSKSEIEHEMTGAPGSEDLGGAVGGEQGQCDEQQDQSRCTGQGGGQDLAPMLLMELGPGGQFGTIIRFDTLFAIPPGAAAVEVIPNIRRADDRHGSPIFV